MSTHAQMHKKNKFKNRARCGMSIVFVVEVSTVKNDKNMRNTIKNDEKGA